MKKYLVIVAAAVLGGIVTLGGAHLLGWDHSTTSAPVAGIPQNVHLTSYVPGNNGGAMMDFTYASAKTLPGVVHIQSTIKVKEQPFAGGMPFDLQNLPDPFRQFFGDAQPQSRGRSEEHEEQGVGSGVIISSDGYIATNNHVVNGATDIKVTLNDKREYDAKVIGTDPSTDLALIKIDARDLPSIPLANSDEVQVGQWVVAVGNPFNLASTVTAGIVSAKGRDIHIVADKAPIESFIQTDAVVNPGNSGGALVNLSGELIGINTAIASPTGVYAGYAFAIPSNIVAKIVEDIKKFGVVQRGYLGITIRDVNGSLAKEKDLNVNSGVYVDSLVNNSAAAAAGVKVGDVIQQINGQAINSSPELLEAVGRHRPGDKLTLTVLRKGSQKEIPVTLKNRAGNEEVVKKSDKAEILRTLGADFETLSKADCGKYGIKGGVRVSNITGGKLSSQTDVQNGFIITKVNNESVSSVDELVKTLQRTSGGVMLEGIYPNESEVFYYAFGL